MMQIMISNCCREYDWALWILRPYNSCSRRKSSIDTAMAKEDIFSHDNTKNWRGLTRDIVDLILYPSFVLFDLACNLVSHKLHVVDQHQSSLLSFSPFGYWMSTFFFTQRNDDDDDKGASRKMFIKRFFSLSLLRRL